MTEAASASLQGLRILVVEDEYLLAEDLARNLKRGGAEVVGPAPSLARARQLVETDSAIDGAVLDVNLKGEMVWPIADALLARSVPIVFATGYDAAMIPEHYVNLPRCEKPVAVHDLARALVQDPL
ncbi:response regulator [Sphingomonas gilva]|uniref:Response regulator n=1 Tax=Sphingomonas gilva TaxID=2305907 RepID=A0A396RNV9_9SPHN|nr:response regulator [Sphingomonas gilva]RHW18194.1 response regulator [Sphingomonas gilva]